MKTKLTLMTSFAVGTALACLALRASAGSESFTTDYGSASAPFEIGGPNLPVLLTLPKFDTALGSLTGIEVTLTSSAALEAEVLNFGAASTFSNAQATGTVTATGLDGVQALVTLTTTPFSGPIAQGSFISPASVEGPTASLTGTGDSAVAPADFSAYEENGLGGTINFLLDATFVGTFSGDDNSGLLFGGEVTDYGSIQVDYTYLSAPDSWSLLPELTLLGFCGLASVDWMRRPISAKVFGPA